MRRTRTLLAITGLLVLLLGTSTGSQAQPMRTIRIAMSSWKFEPSVISFNEGDRVILDLQNIDAQRPHNVASPYLQTVDFTVTGEAKQGVSPDGWKYVLLDPGKKALVTFVARGHGQWSFICSVFNHASLGETGAFIVWPPGYHLKP